MYLLEVSGRQVQMLNYLRLPNIDELSGPSYFLLCHRYLVSVEEATRLTNLPRSVARNSGRSYRLDGIPVRH